MPTLTPEQITELTEAAVNEFFSNSLTLNQHTFAVQITKEIFVKIESKAEMESKASALQQFHERVTQFEQDFQIHLKQADTPQQLSALRFAILWLQFTAGGAAAQKVVKDQYESLKHSERGIKYAEAFLAQGETEANVHAVVLMLYSGMGYTLGNAPFNDAKQQLTYYQRGLDHAETFLTQGETNAAVLEWILDLYSKAGVTLGNAPFNDAKQELILVGNKFSENVAAVNE